MGGRFGRFRTRGSNRGMKLTETVSQGAESLPPGLPCPSPGFCQLGSLLGDRRDGIGARDGEAGDSEAHRGSS